MLGYFKDFNDNIVCKADLPEGNHPIKPGYTFVRVNTQKELDAVEITPPVISAEEKVNDLIKVKIKELAIEALKAEGKLKQDGTLKEGA